MFNVRNVLICARHYNEKLKQAGALCAEWKEEVIHAHSEINNLNRPQYKCM